MTINRVTHQMSQRSSLANLQTNLAAMAKLQGQASSLKRIERASDDPAATAQALRLRSEQRAVAQYDRNAQDGLSWLNTVDTALITTSEYLRRARDLVVSGGNGANGATAREALASELEGLRDSLLAQANTTFLGRSVFAGNSDAGAAFVADPAADGGYAYQGGAGQTVQRRIADETTVRVDGDGAAAFGTGADSVFALLDRVAADLRAGADVSGYLVDVDARLDAVLTEAATIGARTNQVTATQSANLSRTMTLKSDISGLEDIDLAATLIDLQAQEVAYKASLAATSRVLQPTLLDYLR